MKKLFPLLMVTLMSVSVAAHPGGNTHYVTRKGTTFIYRATETVALLFGSIGAAFLGIFPAMTYMLDGKKAFDPRHSELAVISLPTTFFSIGSLSWGCYKYLYSLYKKNRPLMKINKKKFYLEGHGWHSWNQVDAPVIVEKVRAFQSREREICIPLKKTKKLISLSQVTYAIGIPKLLEFINPYKSVWIPTTEQLLDNIPFKLQTVVDEDLRKKIMNDPSNINEAYAPRTITVVNCIKNYPHTCNHEWCKYNSKLDEKEKQQLRKDIQETLLQRRKIALKMLALRAGALMIHNLTSIMLG